MGEELFILLQVQLGASEEGTRLPLSQEESLKELMMNAKSFHFNCINVSYSAPGFCWDQLCVIQLMGPRWCLACLCCSLHFPRVFIGSFAWPVRRGEGVACVVTARGPCDVKPIL